MAYEWDAVKVRKAYRAKMAVAGLVALVMATEPLGMNVAGLTRKAGNLRSRSQPIHLHRRGDLNSCNAQSI